MDGTFLSCDWGTSAFRLRRVEDGRVREQVRTDQGTAKLAAQGGDRPAAFREVLHSAFDRVGGRGSLPVVISGMASSSIGWRELPYARLPFALDGRDAVWAEIEPGVFLVSGLRSETDVLRGEETEAVGLAALGRVPAPRAALVLPGTHSKHLLAADGRVAGLNTFMTGEVFEVMGRHSVLRHSVDPEAPLEREAFLAGAREGAGQPLSAALFRVRTSHVLQGTPPGANASFLSGLLVGAEAEALRALEGVPVVLAASGRLAEAYAWAFEAAGLAGRLSRVPAEDVERLSVLGQGAILRRIQERR
jgi:2-dehydro-3-deoxygalactonokinase